ncbi:MAG: SPOR domain-containing protein [Salinivenus sp.]
MILLLAVGACSGLRSTGSEDETTRVYRVQLRMTEDKAEAEQALGTAMEWWTDTAPGDLPDPLETAEASPVEIAYRTPLYRVRLGPFASRDDAEAVLAAAQEAYPEAFIVPDERTPGEDS